MRITYTVGSYNERRYSAPWIAKITAWPIGGYPTLVFGACVDGHEAEIDANPGDLVKYGQKDYRNKNGTENDFAVVTSELTLKRLTAGEARKAWMQANPQA